MQNAHIHSKTHSHVKCLHTYYSSICYFGSYHFHVSSNEYIRTCICTNAGSYTKGIRTIEFLFGKIAREVKRNKKTNRVSYQQKSLLATGR